MTTPSTLPELVAHRAAINPAADACFHHGDDGWVAVTWVQLQEEVAATARGLRQVGLARGDRVAIWARTRHEWFVAEMAAVAAGAAVVGIDAHAPRESVQFVLENSGATVLVVDDASQLQTLSETVLSRLRVRIAFDASGAGRPDARDVLVWRSIRATEPSALQLPDADAPAALIYTSGTTGRPRAIEYSHRQLLIACRSIVSTYPQLEAGDRTICWLPMAPLFQRMMNYAAVARGLTTYFVTDPREVMSHVRDVQPSVFVGVPRFYEKLQQGIEYELEKAMGPKRWLIRQALARGAERSAAQRCGHRERFYRRAVHSVLDRLVLRRVRAAMGGRMKFMITGSAPIAPWLLEYFHSAGLLLLEAYGSSENAVPIAGNRPDRYRFGSVGVPFPTNEVRIDSDGEVLVRGPGLFGGYLDDQARDRFTTDGFYRTGDLGRFDNDGFLYLTGRKAELIKTSTGRRISPVRVETAYRRSPLIEQMVVIGDGRPELSALITLNQNFLDRRACSPEDRRRAPAEPVEELLRHELERLGGELAPYESVRRFAILPSPLTVEGGELTPSLKLRRNFIEQKYSSLIESLYAAHEGRRERTLAVS